MQLASCGEAGKDVVGAMSMETLKETVFGIPTDGVASTKAGMMQNAHVAVSCSCGTDSPVSGSMKT